MRGFTPKTGGLITIEHGGRCQGAAPGFCRVTYRWDPKSRLLDIVSKTPSRHGPESMQYSQDQLSWIREKS